MQRPTIFLRHRSHTHAERFRVDANTLHPTVYLLAWYSLQMISNFIELVSLGLVCIRSVKSNGQELKIFPAKVARIAATGVEHQLGG